MGLPFYVYDMEVFPNYTTMVIIDIGKYLTICSKLDKVPIFKKEDIVKEVPYITFKLFSDPDGIEDIDDIAKILSFFTKPMFLGSFNGLDYDNLLINYLTTQIRIQSIKILTNNLYKLSKNIIQCQKLDIKDDYLIKLKYFKGFYKSIDVQKVFALDKIKKSLKQAQVNLNWYNILDYNMPAITPDEYKSYPKNWNTESYAHVEQWDRYVYRKHISSIEHYCFNDTASTCEIIRVKLEDITLRMNASIKYRENLLSLSKSAMADAIFINKYCKLANITNAQLRAIRPIEKNVFYTKNFIPDGTKFVTKEFQSVLEYFYTTYITSVDDDKLKYEITLNNTTYNFAKGGIHSVDYPAKFVATDDYYIIDADVTSFYPLFAVLKKIGPKHLNIDIFIKSVLGVITDRVNAKHRGDMTEANTLKIVINSGVFGKLGFKFSPFYDRSAMFGITIGGQLTIAQLIEQAEVNNFEVISANTDGFVTIVPKKLAYIYFNLCREWEEKTGLRLEYSFYDLYVRKDVNNYISVKAGSKPLEKRIKRKGELNKNLFLEDLQKGYNAPIVAKAIEAYYLYNTPIMDTIMSCNNIEDFLITTKPDKSFNIVAYEVKSKILTKTILTPNNRYFVSNNGCVLCKVKATTNEILNSNKMLGNRLIANHYVTSYNKAYEVLDFKNFNIDYMYYYNRVTSITNKIDLNIRKNMKKQKTYIKHNLNQLDLL